MSEIDRRTSKSREHKKPKLLKVMMAVLIVAVLFASSLSPLSNPSSEIPPTPIPAGISYTSHTNISINGNAQFNNTNFPLNGVVSGSGIVSDPYIISGWNISAASAHGIRIQNTNAYFIVRDCYVHSGGSSYYGIYLSNCVNGTLNNNTCSNNQYGIYLGSSGNNRLNNNTCSSNSRHGIYLVSSSGNTFSNNTCRLNPWAGIWLESSSNSNTLNNNTCSSNSNWGIALESSSSNTLINNTCSNNNYGIRIGSSSGNTVSSNNCSSNSVGINLQSSSGNIISNNNCSSNSVGISLLWSSSNTVSNNTCRSNSNYGILLDSSCNSNTVSSNNCSSNGNYGIVLSGSCNSNTISNNNCSNNREGIRLGSSSGNTISSNNCSSNIDYGIRLISSNSNTLSNNTCNSNPRYGINLESSSSNTLRNNTLVGGRVSIYGTSISQWNTHSIDTSNTVNGKPVRYYKNQSGITVPAGAGQVILANCTDFIIENQNLSGSTCGIEIGFSSNVIVTNNDCSNSADYGIYLYSSSGSTISNNTCSDNQHGIHLVSSSGNILINNTCSSNHQHGIYLVSSSGNTFSNNTCRLNPWAGIWLESSSNSNTLNNNTCSSNSNWGIALESSSSNTLINNTCSNNNYGIRIGSSSGNTVSSNNCSSNSVGINLQSSSGNTVSSNNCSSNSVGINLQSSSGNIISSNNCSSNGNYGIVLSGSCNSNTISNNNCSNNREGIRLGSSSGNTISSNNCSSNIDYGIRLISSNSNEMTRNQLCDNSLYGVHIDSGCSSNRIRNNTFIDNNGGGVQAYDAGTNNHWNSSSEFGNYWSDLTGPDSIPPYGIVDWSYNLTGSAGAKDYYPLTGAPIVYGEYTPHATISINGNADFAAQALAESWPGDGSIGNPYIIQGYDINASSAHGIFIQNTDVHFIVRDCYVHYGEDVWEGIYLSNCANGTVTGNICTNNWDGIYLVSSSNNTISNNTISNNNQQFQWGIYLVSSNGNTISNNTCSNNEVGIYLYMSDSNMLRNNTLVNDGILIGGPNVSDWNTHSIDTSNTVNGKPVYYCKNQSGITVPAGAGQVILANCTDFIIENQNLSDADGGIVIGFSSNIIVRNNTCSDNQQWGISLYSSSDSTLSNNTCSNNGYGIYILWASSNNTVSNNTCSSNTQSGIYLISTSDNTISNNTCSDNRNGVSLYYSDGTIVSNNTCSSNNWYGTYLYESSNNTLSSNNCSSNDKYGMYIISSSSNNTIWNNTFIGNNGAGSVYDVNHIQANDSGTNNHWNSSSGYGNWWSDWQTPDVVPPYGIVDVPYLIAGSAGSYDYYPLTTPPVISFTVIRINSNAEFASMAITWGWPGDGTPGNPYVISGYIIDATGYPGAIYIGNTTVHFIVSDCSLQNAAIAGIYLYNATNGTVINNNCSNNGALGIYLGSSSNNILSNNNCSNNAAEGIFLYLSDDNIICNSIFSYSTESAIDISASNGNTLFNNTCSHTQIGINLRASSTGNTVSNNSLSNNFFGMWISSSNNTTISNNTCYSNTQYGILLDSSSSNTLSNNTCYSNNKDGIYLVSSSGNTISDNNCSSNDLNGIRLYLSSNNTLSNNTCSNNLNGIYLYLSSNNTVSNNTCSSNTQYGIGIVFSSNSNTMSNNNCSNNDYGIILGSSSDNTISWNQVCNNTQQGVYLASGSNNTIRNNTFIDNNGGGVQAYDDGTNNWWNSTSGYGNWWSDWQTPDVVPPFGIVDDPYLIAGSAGAYDYYPLTTPSAPSLTVIRIDSDSEFASMAATWGWPGDGTPGNPYVISGYVIDATGYTDAIYIGNTTVHFIVSDCRCTNASVAGIELFNCVNGTLINNICSNNQFGIYLWSSSNNTLSNNTCSNNYYGIILSLSNGNTISNNTCRSNYGYAGMVLGSSSGNTVNNNNCSSNDYYGIYLLSSSNSNTISNNTCSDNLVGIRLESSSNSNTLNNNTCNSNTQYGMYLYLSCNNNTISNNTCSNNKDGILLESSSSNTISNNNCSSNDLNGIRLYLSCNNNTISNNTCSNNQRGIFLYSNSDNNMIIGNMFLWNSLEGVYVETGAGNRIWNNTFAFNNGSTLLYDWLHIQAYESGSGNWWNSTSGYGNWWADWTTPDNFAPFGIVDFVYYISGTSGARDYYPQTHAMTPPYDFIPPTAASNVSGVIGSDGWYISSVNFVLSASDNAGGSGVDVIRYRINGAAWLDYSSPFNVTSDGNHVLEFYAVDNAGNEGTHVSLTLKVDRTAPSLSIDQANGTVFTSSSVDISWTASDSMSGLDHYEFSLDGGMWLSPADNTTTLIPLSGLSNGTHRFDLRAMDHAGNITERNISFFVDIMLAPPEDFNIMVGGVGGANIVLTWSAVSGADHYNIYIGATRNGFDLDSPSATTTSTSWTHFNANLIGDGNYSQEYFYLVRAVGTSGIEDSNINILGKHTYELEGATGGRWNQFALALEPLTPYTADSLADAIPSCDGIAWFNQTSQQWTFHATAMPAGVFDTTLETATGYQVSINNASPVQFTLVGR